MASANVPFSYRKPGVDLGEFLEFESPADALMRLGDQLAFNARLARRLAAAIANLDGVRVVVKGGTVRVEGPDAVLERLRGMGLVTREEVAAE